MAAAYAALVSLIHVLDNIQLYGHHLISLDADLAESLRERVDFLIDFMDGYYNTRGVKAAVADLESQVRDAAYAAEELIESHIVNQIVAPVEKEPRKLDLVNKLSSTDDLAQELKEIINRLDSIKNEVMEMGIQMEDQKPNISTVVGDENCVNGLDEVSIEILNRVIGQDSCLQIIPIFGMRGIGKTTIANNVYEHPLVLQYFDYRVWVTISQEDSVGDILYRISREIGVVFEADASDDRWGELINEKLFERRYLIVMDDIWSIDVWDKLKLFLPDNNNGSRVMMTIRLSNVANHFGSCGIMMGSLNEGRSWSLFCEIVFGREDCPIEFEVIGKKILKNCRGHPLSISVMGGFLAKSEKREQLWKSVAEDLNSIVNLEDGEHCLKILDFSYSYLPIHLKPCFLYFGFYPEDHEFVVSKLIRIWVAEGFLKPNKDKTLEEVAEDCIRDLVDRNLLLVRKRGRTGKIKTCTIHELLRGLCLKELKKESFLHNIQLLPCVDSGRRLFIPRSTSENTEFMNQIFSSFQPTPSVRSLLCDHGDFLVPWQPFRLLRVWDLVDLFSTLYDDFREVVTKLVNIRYLSLDCQGPVNVHCSMHQFWNLQTLIIVDRLWIVTDYTYVLPNEIWEMRQLRHIIIDYGLSLPQPIMDDHGLLPNLQTLLTVENFRFTEEAVKRIPNVKKLGLFYYGEIKDFEDLLDFCLNNLTRLTKLESLNCRFTGLVIKADVLGHWLAFPCSLKRLTLEYCKLSWEDMSLIGALPNLQVLNLHCHSFVGVEWIPNEGEFLRLRFLKLKELDLEVWAADNTHFPCLEHLFLWNMSHLIEIPSKFSDIPTFRSIELLNCTESTVISAQRIREERESIGDQDFKLVK